MGLSIGFYTGDCEAISQAVRVIDFELLDDANIVSHCADLSLHIEPKDLNLLSREMGHASGREPIDLRQHLSVVVDEEDRGVLAVDPEWVAYIAAVPTEAIPEVAKRWAGAMAVEYQGPEIVVNDDMLRGVTDLINLCKHAEQVGEQVMHIWFL